MDGKRPGNRLQRYASQWGLANRRYIAFGAVMLGSSLMNNLFVTYYIMFFTQVEILDSSWFYIGQIVFAIWNAVNDPLFGWLSDNVVTTRSRTSQRLRTLRIGGYVWVGSFLCLWYPWSTPIGFESPSLKSLLAGLHFITSLIVSNNKEPFAPTEIIVTFLPLLSCTTEVYHMSRSITVLC